jgi:anti-sigma regulatory factor (Ser/Thr protein kinase)
MKTLPMDMTRKSLHQEIPSRLAEADLLCQEIRSLLEENGLAAVCFPVELLAREFLKNAIVHGNGRDDRKKVALKLHIGRKWIHLQVIDEGPGFNWRKARRAPPPHNTAVSGRGLSIAALYAQRITFSQRGNQVTLWLNKVNKNKNQGGPKKHGRIYDRT